MLAQLGSYALLAFGSLFAMLSPLATVPAFLAMTEGHNAVERTQMARRACTIAFIVMAAFTVVGSDILGLFRITVPAFQIAGGLVILRVSLEMLQGNRESKVVTAEERLEAIKKDDPSITPLAVPLLCGPGMITTGIILSSQASTWLHTGILLAIVLIIYVGTFILLRLAARYLHVFGEITLKVTARLMGLLLAAIAVQFILDGIRASGLGGG